MNFQYLHAKSLVLPGIETDPNGQDVQVPAPVFSLYVPEGHNSHASFADVEGTGDHNGYNNQKHIKVSNYQSKQ